MRLNSQQLTAIVSVFDSFLSSKNAELRLYGSRTNDKLSGGDIDLWLLSNDLALLTTLVEKKHFILAKIKKEIGDQKIDLRFSSFDDLEVDNFLKIIYPNSLVLKTW